MFTVTLLCDLLSLKINVVRGNRLYNIMIYLVDTSGQLVVIGVSLFGVQVVRKNIFLLWICYDNITKNLMNSLRQQDFNFLITGEPRVS